MCENMCENMYVVCARGRREECGGGSCDSPSPQNRELQIMRMLDHPNVVAMKHNFYTTEDNVWPGKWVGRGG